MSYRRNLRRRRIHRRDPAVAPALAERYAARRIRAVARIKHIEKVRADAERAAAL